MLINIYWEKGFSGRRQLATLIRRGSISCAGNRRLLIYGKLDCASGKRMKPGNRVFFGSEQDAINNGYRPCGHCMRAAYRAWKENK